MKLLLIDSRALHQKDSFDKVASKLISSFPQFQSILIGGNPELEMKIQSILDQSSEKNFEYSEEIAEVESHFLKLVRELFPVQLQSSVLSFVRKEFNKMDDLCKGVHLLKTLPANITEEIYFLTSTIYGFLLSSYLQSKELEVLWNEKLELNENKKTGCMIPEKDKHSTHLISLVDEKIQRVEYWTAQEPYFTADPEWVELAECIGKLTYEEAIELNSGSNGLSPQLLGITSRLHIPLHIINIHQKDEKPSTIIQHGESGNSMATGISCQSDIALLSIEGSGMIGMKGFAKKVFEVIHEANVNVILISQGGSEHSICIAVDSKQVVRAKEKLTHAFQQEISNGLLESIKVTNDVLLLGLVGENMRNHTGVSGRMFNALGKNGINILAIAQGSTERNISATILKKDKKKALNVLHETFFEQVKKEINLYIVGTGNVGKKLVHQLIQQAGSIEDWHHIRIRIAGLSNSRKMVIDPAGIAFDQWETKLNGGTKSDLHAFADEIIDLNLRNSVVVDVTANEHVPEIYEKLLRKSISVVACNKIAASSAYTHYKLLKSLAREFNCKFLFETNVGAALPVISTLNDLINSGDRIKKMEAVLSGTLNFVFNNYDGTRPFAEVVRQAQDEGYTEPDPRLDLSGTDVMRKIMILAREAGNPLEMDAIACNGFLPDSCFKGSVEDFYREMLAHESHFQGLLKEANDKNTKLKFVATYENGKASVGLKHIEPESDMYHLYGKDNIVLFYTDRYLQQPLVVKGAGAGAEVTASGVFADIMRTINR
ncbi:MAG: bifunctional aspartate kinase/homoserine dehydrogenase [Bacteroidota bacterium]